MKVNEELNEILRRGKYVDQCLKDNIPHNYCNTKLIKGMVIATILSVPMWILIFLLISGIAHSSEIIDLKKIRQIESSDCKNMYGWSEHAVGCYQITQIVIDEWNNFHPQKKYLLNDMFDYEKSEEVAYWYLTKRIPQMLRFFNKEVNETNIIIAYNAGISYVAHNKPLPNITKKYLVKYKEL